MGLVYGTHGEGPHYTVINFFVPGFCTQSRLCVDVFLMCAFICLSRTLHDIFSLLFNNQLHYLVTH